MIAVPRSCRLGIVGSVGIVRMTGVVCLCMATVVSATARAESVVVLPASGENVSAAIVDAARVHLVDRLTAMGRGRLVVVDRPGPATSAPIDPVAAIEIARGAHIDTALALRLSRFDNATLVTITGYSTTTGRAPFQSTERITAGPQVLFATIDQMVYTLLSQGAGPMNPQQPLGTPSISARSTREVFVGAGLGMQVAFNTGGRDTRWLGVSNLFLMKSTPDATMDFRFEYATEGSAYLISLGGGFYRAVGESGLCLGAVAKWTWLQLGGQAASGIALAPAAEFFYRMGTSPDSPTPILRVSGSYVFETFQQRELDRLIPGSDQRHLSHGPLITVGVAL